MKFNRRSKIWFDCENRLKSIEYKFSKLSKINSDTLEPFCWVTTHLTDEDGQSHLVEEPDEELINDLNLILQLIKKLDNAKLDAGNFSIKLIVELVEFIDRIDILFDEVIAKKYDDERRGFLEKEIYRVVDKFQDSGEVILLWDDLSTKQQELNDVVSEYWSIKKPGLDILEKDWKDRIENAKLLETTAATNHQANNYDNQSKFHKTQSNWWLCAIILIFVIISGLCLFFYSEADNILANNEKDIVFIYKALSRTIVLVVMFYALSICAKNYKVHQHNMFINKHRYNALGTFEHFMRASNDDKVKEAMLKSVFDTIFINQSTGYETEYSSPREFLEPMKDLLSKKT